MISLSIFIPTYKRLNRLFELLMLIDLHHKESDIIKDNVEIVISSNDFNEYEKILVFSQNNIKYFKPRVVTPYKNINGDNNIAASSSLTYGKYIWILCDDDLCSLDSIEYILNCINKYNFSLLYLEPLIIKPDVISTKYNTQKPDLKFSQIVLDKLNTIDKTYQIDNKWLADNIFSLLRASSLVYSREKTHKYWTSFFYKNGNGIASFCIALDALCGGLAIRSALPKYIYLDANKESWANSWLYIYYFELIPVAELFLMENKIEYNKNNFKINNKDYYSLILSLSKNWKKFLINKNIKQLFKYLFK
jgi:hypothetical protein